MSISCGQFCREVGKTVRKNNLNPISYRLSVLPAFFQIDHYRLFILLPVFVLFVILKAYYLPV